MKHNKDHTNDKWYRQVQKVIQEDEHPSLCIEHCYEIKNKTGEYCNNDNIPSVSSPMGGLYYGGYLHLPELHILLPTTIVKYVDVDGFGKEDIVEVPSLLHMVVDMECAKECNECDIIPDGTH